MLILSRKPGDAILIDGGIRVVVLASDHGGVRLGIEAPPSIGIVREEIAGDIAKENIRAGATAHSKIWLESLDGAPDSEGGGEGEQAPTGDERVARARDPQEGDPAEG